MKCASSITIHNKNVHPLARSLSLGSILQQRHPRPHSEMAQRLMTYYSSTHPLYFPSLSPFSLLALILGFPTQNNPCAGGDNDQPCDDGDSHMIQSIRAGWCMGHVCIFKQLSDKTKIRQINLKVIHSALEMAVLIVRMTLKGHLCGSVC